MSKFKVAHLHEQGQDIIIIVVGSTFGHSPRHEQDRIYQSLQACALGAGLRGTVVPVWDAGGGRMGFLAPQPWQPFFRSLTLEDVAASVNRELTCG